MPSDPVRDGRLESSLALLRRHWGHEDLRPAQRPVVEAILAGRDVLAVLPTGGGKSLCFQLPALTAPGLTLVVSPLIALMEDQVTGARRRGLPAAALTSASDPIERRSVLGGLAEDRWKLLYVSPERLVSPAFRSLLERVPVGRIAVDEAHCISEWGHDFRPAYRRIAEIYGRTGRPPVSAFTATAPPPVRADIVRSLRLREPVELVAGLDRPNLRWEAERTRNLSDAAARLLELVAARPGAAVLYTGTRMRSVRLAAALRRRGVAALPYHAGLEAATRARIQEAFLSGETRAVCATSAFGMGIDHPSVRTVAHLGIPGSLEAYVQESGRAGRDGDPALCLLVSFRGDHRLPLRQVAESWPAPRTVERVWRALPEDGWIGPEELARRLSRRLPHGSLFRALEILVGTGAVREGRETVSAGGDRPLPGSPLDSKDDTRRWHRARDRPAGRPDLAVCTRGRRRGRARLRAMRRYLGTRRCRRRALARHFGERPPACASCDNCGPSSSRGSGFIRGPGTVH